jgi:putative transposase
MTSKPSMYHRHRFPAEIISHAVWLYHVFSLSLRDVELILAERGIIVTRESVRRWNQKFGPEYAKKLRRRRPKPGDTWHLDEVLIPSANSELPICSFSRELDEPALACIGSSFPGLRLDLRQIG